MKVELIGEYGDCRPKIPSGYRYAPIGSLDENQTSLFYKNTLFTARSMTNWEPVGIFRTGDFGTFEEVYLIVPLERE